MTLRGFKLGANLTWSDSKLAISDVESAIWGEVGSSDWLDKNMDNRLIRSLEGQSEWIFNIDFSYTNEDWERLPPWSTVSMTNGQNQLHTQQSMMSGKIPMIA